MGFPCGVVVKNLPADAGSQFGSLVWEEPHATEQLNPRITTTEPVLWSPSA